MPVWLLVAFSIHACIATTASLHAVFHRPNARSALLWIGFVWSVPVLSAMAYLSLGFDRIHSRRALLKGRTRDELRLLYPSLPELTSVRSEHRLAEGDPLSDLHVVAGRLSQRLLLKDNDFTLLRDGEQTFPAMLADIAAAQISVNLMSYIFDEDDTGAAFIEALVAAVKRGVSARLLYDAAGCVSTPNAFFNSARDRGLRVEPFFPLNPLSARAQLYLRNHRKILTVDGKIGYFGGINISARHLASDESHPERCHDLHVRARGPLVQQLQEVFAEDWYYAAGEELVSDKHFPAIDEHGDSVGRVITGGPDEEHEHILLLFFQAINSARRTLRIATPYFIPTAALKLALRGAALRGVDTQLFLPGVSDHPLIRRASYTYLPALAQAGVKIFESPPPFVHTKAVLVDGKLALLGSANVDPRSMRLNYELMVEMSHSSVLGELEAWFDEARARGAEITLGDLKRRPWRRRFGDRAANLFSPLM